MRGVLSFTLTGIFLFTLEVFATEIPAGPVFGDWYASGNPYNVNGEIIIPMDSILNIHPGVQVIFQGHYKFIINGILEANGVEGDSILFTAADTSTGWHSLRFLSAQDTSHLTYCIIQYGRAPGTADPDAQGGGICCIYSNLVVSHCTIRRNYAEWCAAGILLDQSPAIVDSCNIIENYTDGGAGGILVRYDPPGATIRNCIITDNTATAVGGGGGGIFVLYAHDVNINDCQILNNEGYHEGGGILLIGSTAAITGCEVSGNSTYNTNFWGGGGIAVCDISTAEIRNCTVTNNIAPNWIGGGISVGSSEATISDCEIASNTSDQGGGMNIQGSEVTLTGCDIRENNSTTSGGGIFVYAYNWQVDLTMSNCAVVANEASGGGGGIRFYNAGYATSATLQNCVIASNQCMANGGGISDNNFDLTIDQSTFSGNYSGSLGAEIFITNVYPTISNTIVEGSSGNSSIHFNNALYTLISYCDVYNNAGPDFGGSVPPGMGDLVGINGCGDSCDAYMNIFMDPLFRDPANGDYHLQSMTDPQCGDSNDSPCIDAGDPNILDSLLDCSWGLGGTCSDMGAFGGGEIQVNIGDPNIQLPGIIALAQNYPNPFNAQTTIGFTLPNPQDVRLTIYDLLGRRVETLLDEYMQAGAHSITFDASNISSGVYFYSLQAGDMVENKRMLLLK